MQRFFALLAVIARRRSTPPVPADAVGVFEIAATLSTIDHVELVGVFNIAATVSVA